MQARLRSNQLGRRVAIHLRHLQVHEHNVERRRIFAFRQDDQAAAHGVDVLLIFGGGR